MKKQSNSAFKILLVEDDEITNYITTTKLRNLGFDNIAAVLNGQLALDYLQDNQPNLIFLDVNMPIMDGFEFLNAKSESNICPDVPIVILTSSSRPTDKEKASKFKNVIDYLEKPLSYDKIQKVLLAINQL
jgi:two-component system nitrate/nitrite response regulator NarL